MASLFLLQRHLNQMIRVFIATLTDPPPPTPVKQEKAARTRAAFLSLCLETNWPAISVV
jgi:hypothetical protein